MCVFMGHSLRKLYSKIISSVALVSHSEVEELLLFTRNLRSLTLSSRHYYVTRISNKWKEKTVMKNGKSL